MVQELRSLWNSFPHRMPFIILLIAWLALFHFIGNSTLGYIPTESIFGWLQAVYDGGAKLGRDDELGVMVPWLVGVILIIRREELTQIPKSPWAPALLIVVAGLLLHLAGYTIQQTRLGVTGCIIGLFGITGMLWGRHWMKAFAFPYFLLFFCIPISIFLDSLTLGLRLLSTSLSTGFCEWILNINLIQSGTQVIHRATASAPAFSFDVAPACSGIRSATVVLLLTVTFSFLQFKGWGRRMLLIFLSPIFAVLANVIRLIIVFAVAEAAGQAAGQAVENKFGFVTFLIALFCVFLTARLIREPEPLKTLTTAGTTPNEITPDLIP
ncbi:MAG: exosortase/archaeosortase family protein [Pedosphaera sp.]|nr:exosortase/archaeosortase family protein [Pedosphaera sp.]